MDINRLNQGEKIAGASAIALFIFMFFAWFGLSGQVDTAVGSFGVDTSFNAWDSFDFIDLFLLLTIIVTLVAVGMRASSNEAGFPMSSATTILGAISTLLILYRIIDPPGGLDRKLGVFLGLIAAVGIAVGGYLAMQDEGTSFADAADRVSGGGASDPSEPPAAAPPPPPPPPPASTPSEPPPPPPPPTQGA